MSLFNELSAEIVAKGLSSTIEGGFTGAIERVLGTSPLARFATSAATGVAVGLINKHMPASVSRATNAVVRAGAKIANGDIQGAALEALDSGIFGREFANLDGLAAQTLYWGAPIPLMGGLTPAEVRQIHDESQSVKWARKNWFIIEVSSALRNDFSKTFNLFCTELDYSQFTLSGEKRRIGSASTDMVNSADPVEMRITTMDDEAGSIKTWFNAQCAATAASDGTVGVPAEYAITIKVIHGVIKSRSSAYFDKGLFRPASLELSLSRREDAFQDLQMTFAQLDTFMAP